MYNRVLFIIVHFYQLVQDELKKKKEGKKDTSEIHLYRNCLEKLKLQSGWMKSS